jgi:hypothetical protein
MGPLLHKESCGRRSVVLEVNERIRSLEHEVASQMWWKKQLKEAQEEVNSVKSGKLKKQKGAQELETPG